MLQPIVVRAPGFGGLNLEGEEIANTAQYAKVAKNLVFDNAGRLASRKGYSQLNDTTADTTTTDQIFVYDYSGGSYVISALGAALWEDGTADRQGSLAHTTADWQFQNFNDKVIGSQAGQIMIVKSGTGNFAAIAPKGGGTVDANGNCCHVAFGRIWATSSAATTLYWCGLLDETEWPSATTPGDSGQLNILSNEAAVRDGYDKIVAINHLDNKLVVFLENSIVIFSAPDDPANMAIYKVITGIGCIARDSVQPVGNDLVFMSRDGLRSLVRALRDDDFPLRDISRSVRGSLIADVVSGTSDVRSAYYPDEGLYILITTNATAWIFDFKRLLEDGQPRVTTWDVPGWHSVYYHEGTLYIGQVGEYGKYDGYQEDAATYEIEYKSLNVDFGTPNFKMIKETRAIVTGAASQTVQFTYEWDYGAETNQAFVSLPTVSAAGVYGTGTYGTAVYGDGISRAVPRVSPFGSGYLVAFGFQSTVENAKFTMEQIAHFATIGRIAR
jgi:hypothetical protein